MFLMRGIKRFSCFLLIIFFIFLNPIKCFAEHSEEYFFDKALEATKNGEFVKALKLWDQVIEISPNDAAALSNRGNVRLILGDPQGDIEDQTMAMKLLPLETDPHLNRGTAEEFLRLWDEAEQDYNWVLNHNPDDVSALYNLGNVKLSQDHFSQAEEFFDKASLLSPGFVMARSSKALVEYQMGKYDLAEHDLRTLIRRYPLLADARAALSALLWRKGNFGEAESNWTAVAGLDSRYRDFEWLLNTRRWPSKPSIDLMAFLDLKSP